MLFFGVDSTQRLGTTAGLGLNQAHSSDLPNHPKYKTNFPLSLLPKSVVVAVSTRCIFIKVSTKAFSRLYFCKPLNLEFYQVC